MTLNWQIFRIICFLQLLATAFLAITSFISLFQYQNGLYYFFESLAYGLMLWLAVIALDLLNNHYPDKPVAGTGKSVFNWLFLLNFLLLSFLFGLFFADLSRIRDLQKLTGNNLGLLPFRLFLPVLISFLVLVFQLIILFGLYHLRRLLYFNFRQKQFDFEK